MSNDEFDGREQTLHYAARLRGLSLIRTGETFALVEFRLSEATLDEVAAYLGADGGDDPDRRRGDLQALLKAEHAMLAELDTERRKADAQSHDRVATEAALAEIRRRIMELSEARQSTPPGGSAWPR